MRAPQFGNSIIFETKRSVLERLRSMARVQRIVHAARLYREFAALICSALPQLYAARLSSSVPHSSTGRDEVHRVPATFPQEGTTVRLNKPDIAHGHRHRDGGKRQWNTYGFEL